MLQPVIEAACTYVGKDRARVVVLRDPAVRGVDQALSQELAEEVFRKYPQVDVLIFCVDRDGRPGRDEAVRNRVEQTQLLVREDQHVGGRTAEQELEVWCLVPHIRELARSWAEVRAEPHAKEIHFEPLTVKLSLARSPGRGREILGREAARNYRRLRALCPELKDIEQILARAR